MEERVKKELEQDLREKLEAQVQKRKEEFERELAVEQRNAQAKIDASQRQLNQLKDQMAKKEDQYRKDMSNATHESDSSRMELRRKMDKLDLSYQDKIEALNEAYVFCLFSLLKILRMIHCTGTMLRSRSSKSERARQKCNWFLQKQRSNWSRRR